MVSTQAMNAREVGSIFTLGAIFATFITRTILIAATTILYTLHSLWLLNLLCVCKRKATACMHVIVCIRRLTIPVGTSISSGGRLDRFYCVYTHIHVYTYLHIHTHIYMYIYVCVYIYICVCVIMHICIYMHIYTCIYIHIYMCILL